MAHLASGGLPGRRPDRGPRRAGGRRAPARAVGLTFDDGFPDVGRARAARARRARVPRHRVRHHRRHRRTRRSSRGTSASPRCSAGMTSWSSTAAGRCASRPTPSRTRVCSRSTTGGGRRDRRLAQRARGPARPAGVAFAYPAGLYGARERRLAGAGRLHGRRLVRAGREPPGPIASPCGGGRSTPETACSTSRRRSAAATTRRSRSGRSTAGSAMATAGGSHA